MNWYEINWDDARQAYFHTTLFYSHETEQKSSEKMSPHAPISWWPVIAILIHLLAGVLTGIQTDFEIDDAHAGLLQTSFITALAIGSPLFGYLGDRYNRLSLHPSLIKLLFLDTIASC